MARERRDNKGRLLLTGEAQIRNGSYTFRYTDENGVRKSITNWKLLPEDPPPKGDTNPESVSYTHLRAHETDSYLVCRLLLEKKKNK